MTCGMTGKGGAKLRGGAKPEEFTINRSFKHKMNNFFQSNIRISIVITNSSKIHNKTIIITIVVIIKY